MQNKTLKPVLQKVNIIANVLHQSHT